MSEIVKTRLLKKTECIYSPTARQNIDTGMKWQKEPPRTFGLLVKKVISKKEVF